MPNGYPMIFDSATKKEIATMASPTACSFGTHMESRHYIIDNAVLGKDVEPSKEDILTGHAILVCAERTSVPASVHIRVAGSVADGLVDVLEEQQRSHET